jgi:hypothetical protein
MAPRHGGTLRRHGDRPPVRNANYRGDVVTSRVHSGLNLVSMARAPSQVLKADDLISNISNSEMISDTAKDESGRAPLRSASIKMVRWTRV